jgi:hypothetical protein
MRNDDRDRANPPEDPDPGPGGMEGFSESPEEEEARRRSRQPGGTTYPPGDEAKPEPGTAEPSIEKRQTAYPSGGGGD